MNSKTKKFFRLVKNWMSKLFRNPWKDSLIDLLDRLGTEGWVAIDRKWNASETSDAIFYHITDLENRAVQDCLVNLYNETDKFDVEYKEPYTGWVSSESKVSYRQAISFVMNNLINDCNKQKMEDSFGDHIELEYLGMNEFRLFYTKHNETIYYFRIARSK